MEPQRSRHKLGVIPVPEPQYPESWLTVLFCHHTGQIVKGLQCQAKEIGPREMGMFEQNKSGPR